MIDIEEIGRRATELVKEVGRFIKEQRVQFDASKIEHKGLHDYVSYVDKTSERQLVDGLSKILPGCGGKHCRTHQRGVRMDYRPARRHNQFSAQRLSVCHQRGVAARRQNGAWHSV